mmetsp:Transcript_14536/g.25500  ORF Transcript_14536/g.25500 Transcript_14536/m.25500 type:complete len:254 (-) Transcript_14536:324-1085(-)
MADMTSSVFLNICRTASCTSSSNASQYHCLNCWNAIFLRFTHARSFSRVWSSSSTTTRHSNSTRRRSIRLRRWIQRCTTTVRRVRNAVRCLQSCSTCRFISRCFAVIRWLPITSRCSRRRCTSTFRIATALAVAAAVAAAAAALAALSASSVAAISAERAALNAAAASVSRAHSRSTLTQNLLSTFCANVSTRFLLSRVWKTFSFQNAKDLPSTLRSLRFTNPTTNLRRRRRKEVKDLHSDHPRLSNRHAWRR